MNVPKKTVIVMDNIRFHHSSVVLSTLKLKGLVPLFTLPYSPKLNAIENVFGVVKSKYRQLCPVHFNSSFDYVKLFVSTLLHVGNTIDLTKFFTRVLKFVTETLNNVINDPINFTFSGYD